MSEYESIKDAMLEDLVEHIQEAWATGDGHLYEEELGEELEKLFGRHGLARIVDVYSER